MAFSGSIKDVVEQLENSGTNFSVEFVGSVPVKISLNSATKDEQLQIGCACMVTVARSAGRCVGEIGDQSEWEAYIDQPEISNSEIDLNITSKSLLVIGTVNDNPTIMYKFVIEDISLVVPGSGTKRPTTTVVSRRCFVFFAGCDKAEICGIMALAFITAEKRMRDSATRSTHSAETDVQRTPSRSPTTSTSWAPACAANMFDSQKTPESPESAQFSSLTAGLSDEPWFHGHLSRADSEAFLIKNNQFLVRQSHRMPNQVILTGMHDNQRTHICLVDDEGKLRTVDHEFSTVSELIHYYLDTGKPLSADYSVLTLSEPIRRIKANM